MRDRSDDLVVDTIRTGRQLRALRHRQRLTQDDVAERARTSHSQVGRAERGHADELRLVDLERVARALGARLDLRISWNGEALDRLLDAAHAAIVEDVVRILTSLGWETAVEVSFNIRGERGSIDVFARHRGTQLGLVVEVKSVIPDVRATLMTLDRKARLGPAIARELGRPVSQMARVLVVSESRTSRRRVDAHRAVFDAALPARTVEVRHWLAHPDGAAPLRGLWFLSSGRPTTARHRISRPSHGAPLPARTGPASIRPRNSSPVRHGSS
jgi:transcriptional regulator with XRE-family HTH domain